MLYLILPISVFILVLRIPVVRLIFGAPSLDWDATLLTGRTLAFFSISIFSQALIALVYRAFYALHDTKTPLITGTAGTLLMLVLGFIFIVPMDLGIASLAVAYSISSILHLIVLVYLLDRRTGGFHKPSLYKSWIKIFIASLFTAFALYLPINLLDQVIINTTRTLGLVVLTGISTFAGLFIYLFLTWFLNVKEASTYIYALRKYGNWREVVGKIQELVGAEKLSP